MARGFGTTYGVGTTDNLELLSVNDFAQISYHIQLYANASASGSASVFDQGYLSGSGNVLLFGASSGASSFTFIQQFTTLFGIWTFPGNALGSPFAGIGVSYDRTSTANDPIAYVGGSSVTVSEGIAPQGTVIAPTNLTKIGNDGASSAAFDGILAEFGIWDVILTPDEFSELGKGYSPLLIRPTSLREYVPLIRDPKSSKVAGTINVTGTAAQPHPRVIRPYIAHPASRAAATVTNVGNASGVGAAVGVSSAININGVASASGVGTATAIPFIQAPVVPVFSTTTETTHALSYIEIDVPHCTLTYSVAPCEASLGVTGDIKCFNSLGTCQDRPHFADSPVTFRFAEDVGYLPDDIECFPFIKEIKFDPAIVSLGGDLGQRATLKVTFRDAPHSDAGPNFDKYPADRNYTDPYSRGSFWGKFRARNPFLRGRNIRLIRGTLGQSIAGMETRYFVIESIDGPNVDGEFSVIAKDVLKLADGDRAQAPLLSNGFLNSDLTAVATSLTLSPVGIGTEYPASGYVAIGGKEIVSYTRSGDVLTITRAQLNTTAQTHAASDRAQLILRYVGADPATIIRDLLVTYAGVNAAYIPLTDWQTETAGFLGVVFTLNICEPTSVDKLISELITQMGAAIWWDDLSQVIRLQILRAVSTDADRWNEDNVLADSLEAREQPEKRVSQVIVYFGQINPLLKIDELSNYRSTQLEVDEQSEIDEGSAAIKKIFARGIAQGGRTTATRIAQKHLSRFVVPPRRFNFELLRYAGQEPHLGIGIRLGGGEPDVSSWPFQDETGARADIPIQITRHSAEADRHIVEAEEMLFTAFGGDINPNDRTIVLDANEFNVNLRTRHDELFSTPVSGNTVTCYVSEGVIIGSIAEDGPSTDGADYAPALDIGTWPAGVTVTLHVRGRIQGHGGAGGTAFTGFSAPGGKGSTALYTRQAIALNLSTGQAQIWGGGGGGGGVFVPQTGFMAGGGGGAGYEPGTGGGPENAQGQPGTTEAGGAGGNYGGAQAGAGGGPGLPGQTFSLTTPGAAGNAIDGISFCTVTGTGDRRGTQKN